MTFPQLRVRTSFSIKRAFAPINDVASRLQDLETPIAGIVDTGTWGHVRFEKALKETKVAPAFGLEFSVKMADGNAAGAWALATDIRKFYNWTSKHYAEIKLKDTWELGNCAIRFSGALLDDPMCFDYIDLNPRSLIAAKRQLELHTRTGKPLVLTSDNAYARATDWDVYLALVDQKRTTPLHILTLDELRGVMNHIPDDILEKAIKGTYEAAERLQGVKLAKAALVQTEGDLDAEIAEGIRYRVGKGHIVWDEKHEQRLKRERELIYEKGYQSYFLVVGDMVRFAKQHMLVGPGRGSSAGSLVCYLLQITEVDPLEHDLLFERFIDVNRSDWPDIDVDLSDVKRELVFDYLKKKYGEAQVARVGNVVSMQPKSVLLECGKRMGVPKGTTFNLINQLIEYSSGDSRYGHSLEDTMIQTAEGKKFAADYPEMALAGKAEQTPFTTSVHAAGVIVNNQPIHDFCTVTDEGVACVDKKDAEYLGLLKIDALGLRTLGVLEDAEALTNQEFYDLKLHDQAAFDVINDKKFSGLFQLEGAAARRVATQVHVTSFLEINHLGALARPGPLAGGGTNSYIKRKNGSEPVTCHPLLKDILAATQGVMVFQESIMRVCREIGDFTWAEVSLIRKSMSGRRGVEFFNQMRDKFVVGSAKHGVSAEDAVEMWRVMVHMGSWAFNASHSVSYGIVTFWTAYVKAHYPMKFAAALLRSNKGDEQVVEMLRELRDEGIDYIPFDPDKSEANWSVQDGVLYGGYMNIVGIGPAKAGQYLAKRKAGTLTKEAKAKLLASTVKFKDLTEGRTLWGDLYDNPAMHGIRGKVKLIGQLEDREDACIIAKIVRRERRDENEAVRFQRRGNKLYKDAQSLFLDMFIVDDSVSQPVLARIKPRDWEKMGKFAADTLLDNKDWVLIRGRWLKGFSMISIDKMRCLTRPEIVFG
jgi:DNA-directed DNA polymerase III PolC